MEKFILRCGDILDIEKFQKWRNFRCGDFPDIGKTWFTLVCCEICFVAMHTILSQNLFFWNLRCFVEKPVLSRFTHFLCGEKLSPKFCPWGKNYKYNVWALSTVFLNWQWHSVALLSLPNSHWPSPSFGPIHPLMPSQLDTLIVYHALRTLFWLCLVPLPFPRYLPKYLKEVKFIKLTRQIYVSILYSRCIQQSPKNWPDRQTQFTLFML